ncbi:MAG: metallophosphoesterase [Planctomycetota bacterium]
MFMTTTLLFNAVMLIVDVAILHRLRVKRSIVAACVFAAAAAMAGFLTAMLLAQDRFVLFRLAAWGVFAHGVVLSLGTAVVFWRSRRGWSFATATLAVTLAMIAIDAFLIEPEWLDVSHVEITSAKLSRPCRIVVLADLQTDRIGPYERRVIQSVAEAQPDVVLLAGDYLQVAPVQWEALRAELNTVLREANLAAHARVFAIQGNIDSGTSWTDIFRGLDFAAVSVNESFDLGGGLRLTCLALEASYDTSTQVAADPEHFHLVLGHCPNFALGKVRADLLVAGHTHGGQVRLPIIGALSTLSRIPRRWAAGLTELPSGGRLLVSRGTGMERGDAPRLRFLCRPELVVIDLMPEKR